MNREMVLAEWQRATQSLRAAELLAREGFHEDAVSRAYYEILHAAKAAMFVHDMVATSHAAVRRLFGQHLINTEEIERQWSSHLGESFDDRLAADYDAGTVFTAAEAQRECQRTRAFVERMQRYLLTKGLTDHDLATEVSDG